MSKVERFERLYEPGDVVFCEGDPIGPMYVVQEGRVRLVRRVGQHDETVDVVDKGAFFGALSLLNSKPRSATAIADAPSRLLELDARTFETMIQVNTEIAVRMVRTLAARLDSAYEALEVDAVRDARGRVLNRLAQAVESADSPPPLALPHALVERLAAESDADFGMTSTVLEKLVEAGVIEAAPNGWRVPVPAQLRAAADLMT